MYGSCNESESEEDNVYRQNVASGDRKKELKSPKPSFSLSRSVEKRAQLSVRSSEWTQQQQHQCGGIYVDGIISSIIIIH